MKHIVRYAIRTRNKYEDEVDISRTPGFWVNTWTTMAAGQFKQLFGFLPPAGQIVVITIARKVEK